MRSLPYVSLLTLVSMLGCVGSGAHEPSVSSGVRRLMTDLVRAGKPEEQRSIVDEIGEALADASEQQRYAALRDFTHAASRRSTTGVLDTGQSSRVQAAFPMLVEELDMSQIEIFRALFPLYGTDLEASARVRLVQAGVFRVEPAEGPDARFPLIAAAVRNGDIGGYDAEATRSISHTMYIQDPEAAAFTWLDLHSESYGNDPEYRRRLEQMLLRMGYLRERTPMPGAPDDSPSLRRRAKGSSSFTTWPMSPPGRSSITCTTSFSTRTASMIRGSPTGSSPALSRRWRSWSGRAACRRCCSRTR